MTADRPATEPRPYFKTADYRLGYQHGLDDGRTEAAQEAAPRDCDHAADCICTNADHTGCCAARRIEFLGAAPRAEGLDANDVDNLLRQAAWSRANGRGFMADSIMRVLNVARRPSDERIPKSEAGE